MKRIFPFPILFLITLFLRSYTLFISDFNWDESLYMLGADSISKGYFPYEKIWDLKPPGIFYLFYFAKEIFGETLLGVRWLTLIFVSSTSYLLFLIVGRLQIEKNVFYQYLAGVFYIVFSLNTDGAASNTELFFVFFSTSAILIAVFNYQNITKLSRFWAHILIGLFLGIGFTIKYFVLMDFAAIWLAFLIYYYQKWGDFQKSLRKLLIPGFISLVYFILPYVLIMLYFQYYGKFDLIVDTFESSGRYRDVQSFSFFRMLGSVIIQIKLNTLLWVALIVGLVSLVRKGDLLSDSIRNILFILLVWLFFDMLAIGLTNQYYKHYYIQTIPALSVIAALVLGELSKHFHSNYRKLSMALLVTLGIFPVVGNSIEEQGRIFYNREILGDKYWGDESMAAAMYVKERVKPEDYVYLIVGQPIIYHLIGSKIPTEYAFPPHYIDEGQRKLSLIDPENEIKKVMEKKPAYIISLRVESVDYYRLMMPILEEDYVEEAFIEEHVIFRRKDYPIN